MSDDDYRFTVRPLTDEEGGGYLVEFPDLPGCMSDGETIEEAIANGADAKRCWIVAMKEAGRPIPSPSVEPAEGYSGKWQLRAPKSLHRRLAERAKREGVSLNTLAVTLLARVWASARRMTVEQSTPYRLDDEQRARVADCLTKEGMSLPRDRLERFIGDIEASIARFRATPPETTFRDAHDALRDLWRLSHDDDRSIGQLRARLKALPNQAIEQLGRRARGVIPQLFAGETIGDEPFDPPERLGARFLEWAGNADGQKLVMALQAMTAEGGQIVQGRSRGGGKRSGLRLEPVIMGEVRGTGAVRHRGGRPRNNSHRNLVMYLARDWLTATGEPPKPGRSDSTDFADLVHSAFQWLSLPEGSAPYALREYWAAVKALKAREPLEDFLKRHGEEL